MKLITFTGMSRSGNHGILRWLTGHYEENGYAVNFYNNTVIPFLEHLNFIFPHVDKSVKKVFLVSFEDIEINQRFSKLSEIADHNILLVRDPLNLFASRIKGLAPDRGVALLDDATDKDKIIASLVTLKKLPEHIKKYHNHYDEFVGNTKLVNNKICIKYNDWVKDEDYRRKIIENQLGLNFSDCRYKNRAGSSFGAPPSSNEEYFDRWKYCWNDSVYEPIKNDSSLIKISEEFGVVIEK